MKKLKKVLWDDIMEFKRGRMGAFNALLLIFSSLNIGTWLGKSHPDGYDTACLIAGLFFVPYILVNYTRAYKAYWDKQKELTTFHTEGDE